MKIFFDHCVDKRLKGLLPEHIVTTAHQMGWAAKKNGELLSLVEDSGFEVFFTVDQNIKHQQNLAARALRFIVLIGYDTSPNLRVFALCSNNEPASTDAKNRSNAYAFHAAINDLILTKEKGKR